MYIRWKILQIIKSFIKAKQITRPVNNLTDKDTQLTVILFNK